jgi:hypothetical protein
MNFDLRCDEFALEIHRTSNRSSFLTYENYLAIELISVEKLMSLGPVTLFFPNVRDVDLDLQMTFENYLKSPARTTHHPQRMPIVKTRVSS